jgi:hypothetical protein
MRRILEPEKNAYLYFFFIHKINRKNFNVAPYRDIIPLVNISDLRDLKAMVIPNKNMN